MNIQLKHRHFDRQNEDLMEIFRITKFSSFSLIMINSSGHHLIHIRQIFIRIVMEGKNQMKEFGKFDDFF
jgi:hypothetical protein